MPIKKDPSGKRTVQVEVEVPGTPEEVWRAIATGPGVSSWFVPTREELGSDGKPTKIICNFGPGMDSVAMVTGWDPPHSFKAESKDLGPNAPAVATEWIVEARSGGKCVVRVVHSLFATTDDWDNQLEGWESGWPGFFRLLKIYLLHFAGMPCTPVQAMGMSSEPKEAAWAKLTGELGVANAKVGERRRTAASAPIMGGVVERTGEVDHEEELLLRVDEPAPGIAHLFAMPMGGQVFLSARLYLYGDKAPAAVAQEEPKWHAWLGERFPVSGPIPGCS